MYFLYSLTFSFYCFALQIIHPTSKGRGQITFYCSQVLFIYMYYYSYLTFLLFKSITYAYFQTSCHRFFSALQIYKRNPKCGTVIKETTYRARTECKETKQTRKSAPESNMKHVSVCYSHLLKNTGRLQSLWHSKA